VGALNSSKAVNAYIPATFLTINGQPAVDPLPAGSQQDRIYSDASGDNPVSGAAAKPNNYIIVPENYSQSSAASFASYVSSLLTQSGETGVEGLSSALGAMTSAFVRAAPKICSAVLSGIYHRDWLFRRLLTRRRTIWAW
jgi:hypothetical protein